MHHLDEQSAWAPENRAALDRLLDRIGRRDADAPMIAVFDWDNTCVQGDVGEATLRYQLDRLVLRLTPAALAEQVPEEVMGQRELVEGISLADIRADILDAYADLWPQIEAGDVEAARALPAHRDFKAKVVWLYEALLATEGIGPVYTLPWLVTWLAGFREDEVRGLVESALAVARTEPLERVTWTSATAGRTGVLETSFRAGIRPHPEIVDLMTMLQRVGTRVYVVSASGEHIVEAAALALGYPVAADHVFGIRVVVRQGVFTTAHLPTAEYPVTWRQGKIDVIRREIGQEPIFVAGDADTDLEMLTSFPTTEVRLVINRNRHGDEIGTLYRAALAAPEPGAPLTLLQGRDENAGCFRPHRETIPLGGSAPTPIPSHAE